jgi:hypothetical protein
MNVLEIRASGQSSVSPPKSNPMSRKVKELERQALRDVERVRRSFRSKGWNVNDLLLLQLAYDRLIQFRTAETIKEQEGKETAEGIPVPRYLYHGTTELLATKILQEGITPRGNRAPSHPTLPSHPECVYLTDAYALSYIIDSFNATNYTESRGAVIEVDFDKLARNNLLPDEDAVDASGNPGVIDKMVEDEQAFATNILWRSLLQHGTVAHRGAIPVSAISRVAYIARSSYLTVVMTRWGLLAIRKQQKTILDWIFDGGDTPFPIPAEEIIFNDQLSLGTVESPAGSQEMAHSLMARGVTADAIWRMRFVNNPASLNRDGIEVCQVTSA